MKFYYEDTESDSSTLGTIRLLGFLLQNKVEPISNYKGDEGYLVLSNFKNVSEYLDVFKKYSNNKLYFILDYTKEGFPTSHHIFDFLQASKLSNLNKNRFIFMYNNMNNFGEKISTFYHEGFAINELSFPFWFYEYIINPPYQLYRKKYVTHDFTCFCKDMRKHKMDALKHIERLNLNVFATAGKIARNEPIKEFKSNIISEIKNIPYLQVSLPNEIYLKGKVSIITETNYDDTRFVNGNTFTHMCHVTEKTFRCFGLKQPFTVVGDSGILKSVKKLGLETFDSLIDESYDLESDENRYIKSIEAAIQLKNHYNSSKLDDILNRNFEKVSSREFILNIFYNNFIVPLKKHTKSFVI